MKIYTKTGDDGTTSLLGGTRVFKFDLQIEAYGQVDELNAHIGLLKDLIKTKESEVILIFIQNKLFEIGSVLANDEKKSGIKLSQISISDVQTLENEIDKLDNNLPPLKNFVLPGGHVTVSQCHIARCVCRRAERTILRWDQSQNVNPLIIQFLNRLSDYLFVLSRDIAKNSNATETIWKP